MQLVVKITLMMEVVAGADAIEVQLKIFKAGRWNFEQLQQQMEKLQLQ